MKMDGDGKKWRIGDEVEENDRANLIGILSVLLGLSTAFLVLYIH